MGKNEDNIVKAICEIAEKPNRSLFDCLVICMSNFGDNVSSVTMTGTKDISKKRKHK